MKKIVLSGLCASSLMLTGCLGQNALFDNVQDWNASATNNKWVNQGISFGFWILPVYGLTLLGDVVVFNSIEYWTGSNPISGAGAKVTLQAPLDVTDGLGNVARLTPVGDDTLAVTETIGGVSTDYTLRYTDAGIVRQMNGEQTLVAIEKPTFTRYARRPAASPAGLSSRINGFRRCPLRAPVAGGAPGGRRSGRFQTAATWAPPAGSG
jgi:hypothetical protein